MTTRTLPRPSATATPPLARDVTPAVLVACALLAASAYGFLAEHPYRDLPAATVTGAHAQDACSLVVAAALLLLARSTATLRHLVRLGLYGYVAYSYLIYLVGLPMNRAFLVYVVLVTAAGAALVDGVVRLVPSAWPRAASRRLERGTGWFLVTVAVLFVGLWLSVLLPFALGGARPHPEGPGGAPYPVFVLDLVVALPCVAAVGVLLVRGQRVGGPLAVVVLVKILTLFTVLWAGVVAALVEGDHVDLGADAGPSLVMLAVCGWLLVRWLHDLADASDGVRPTFWPADPGPGSLP
jgi:hypothetical protein